MTPYRWRGARRRDTPGPRSRARAAAAAVAFLILWGVAPAQAAAATAAAGAAPESPADVRPTLRGRVVDGDGTGIAWARVEARFADGVGRSGALTGEDGRFEIAIHGSGTLTVRRLGYHEWSGTYSFSDAAGEFLVRLSPAPRPIQDVEVTALRRPGRSGDLAVPAARLEADDLRGRAHPLPVLAGRLRETPEVTVIGRDEYNGAPAVRGLARFRTVLFLDGARISSDREIGPTAGFVDPATLQSVEIVRGPGAVLYGTDAIGGIVLLESASPAEGSWAEVGWSSVNRGFRAVSGAAVATKGGRLSLTASRAQAGDYALPGTPWPWTSDSRQADNSGFERSTGRIGFSSARLEVGALYSLGENIGRPAREEEEFSVPVERHLLTTLRWRGPDPRGPLEARAYLHPISWQAHVVEPRGDEVREQRRYYRSTDWGLLLSKASLRESGSWVAGVQTDVRSDVRIERRLWDRDAAGTITRQQIDPWVDGASVGQSGAFVHVLRRTGRARWSTGARVDFAWREGSRRDVRRAIPTGQAGVVVDVGPDVVVTAQVASAFREPSVTELFFAGRRPAGYLQGNPALQPERSFNADLGVRGVFGPLSWGASGFWITVEEFIGLRTLAAGTGGDPDTIQYENVDRASIQGGAFEVALAASRRWSGHAFVDVVRATSGDGSPQADAHPLRGGAEVRWGAPSLDLSLSWRASLAHRRVAVNERAVPGYGAVDVRAWIPVGSFRLGLAAENLLDQEYYERADPVGYQGPGRSVGATISWRGRPLPPP